MVKRYNKCFILFFDPYFRLWFFFFSISIHGTRASSLGNSYEEKILGP